MRDPLSMIDDYLCSGNPEEREVCPEHQEVKPCQQCLSDEISFKFDSAREEHGQHANTGN